MDPEAATALVREGVTLLLLDVPQRTVLGVDTQVGHTSSQTLPKAERPPISGDRLAVHTWFVASIDPRI